MKLKTKKIMARKKMSELTPIERVDRVMKGVSWEDAENVGIEILARCISFNFFVNKGPRVTWRNFLPDLAIECKRGLMTTRHN